MTDLIFENCIPLEFATREVRFQLAKTMSGLEEVILCILIITQIYSYIFKKLALRKKDIGDIIAKYQWKAIAGTFPVCYFAAGSVLLAIVNNLIMLAVPTFPGRAGFGSVVFLIIGAMSLFTIPQVAATLLTGPRKKFLAVCLALIFMPMGAAVLQQHVILYTENNQRLAYVEKMVNQGATYLELEPITVKNQVLRHVYFVELNNGVSKFGFCRYYGLINVKVKYP